MHILGVERKHRRLLSVEPKVANSGNGAQSFPFSKILMQTVKPLSVSLPKEGFIPKFICRRNSGHRASSRYEGASWARHSGVLRRSEKNHWRVQAP